MSSGASSSAFGAEETTSKQSSSSVPPISQPLPATAAMSAINGSGKEQQQLAKDGVADLKSDKSNLNLEEDKKLDPQQDSDCRKSVSEREEEQKSEMYKGDDMLMKEDEKSKESPKDEKIVQSRNDEKIVQSRNDEKIEQCQKDEKLEESQKDEKVEESQKDEKVEESQKDDKREEAHNKSTTESLKNEKSEESHKDEDIKKSQNNEMTEESHKNEDIKKSQNNEMTEEAQRDEMTEEAKKDEKIEETQKHEKIEETKKDEKIEETLKHEKIDETLKHEKIEETQKQVKVEETQKHEKEEETKKDEKIEEAPKEGEIEEVQKVGTVKEPRKGETRGEKEKEITGKDANNGKSNMESEEKIETESKQEFSKPDIKNDLSRTERQRENLKTKSDSQKFEAEGLENKDNRAKELSKALPSCQKERINSKVEDDKEKIVTETQMSHGQQESILGKLEKSNEGSDKSKMEILKGSKEQQKEQRSMNKEGHSNDQKALVQNAEDVADKSREKLSKSTKVDQSEKEPNQEHKDDTRRHKDIKEPQSKQLQDKDDPREVVRADERTAQNSNVRSTISAQSAMKDSSDRKNSKPSARNNEVDITNEADGCASGNKPKISTLKSHTGSKECRKPTSESNKNVIGGSKLLSGFTPAMTSSLNTRSASKHQRPSSTTPTINASLMITSTPKLTVTPPSPLNTVSYKDALEEQNEDRGAQSSPGAFESSRQLDKKDFLQKVDENVNDEESKPLRNTKKSSPSTSNSRESTRGRRSTNRHTLNSSINSYKGYDNGKVSKKSTEDEKKPVEEAGKRGKKRNATLTGAISNTIGEETASTPLRESKRARTRTTQFQSPLPEMNEIMKSIQRQEHRTPPTNTSPPIKSNNKTRGRVGTRATGTASEPDKTVVFYKNEHLALRNADGGFYICQALQNVTKKPKKLNIQWYGEDTKDKINKEIFVPEYFDKIGITQNLLSHFQTILTSVELERLDRRRYRLPKSERERVERILKHSVEKEAGQLENASELVTEDNPDGLDISIFKDEDQLKAIEERRRLEERQRKKQERQETKQKATTSSNVNSEGKKAPKGRSISLTKKTSATTSTISTTAEPQLSRSGRRRRGAAVAAATAVTLAATTSFRKEGRLSTTERSSKPRRGRGAKETTGAHDAYDYEEDESIPLGSTRLPKKRKVEAQTKTKRKEQTVTEDTTNDNTVATEKQSKPHKKHARAAALVSAAASAAAVLCEENEFESDPNRSGRRSTKRRRI